MSISIAIVDDKLPSRVSLSEKITYTNEIVVLFTANNGEDFLNKMKNLKTSRPQAVLMDIEMPLVNGIEAVAIGASLYPETKFLMLTVFDDEDKIFEAIQAGASGYLLKDERVDKIVSSVKEMVEEGGAPMSPGIARKAFAILSKASLSEKTIEDQTNLSSREMEILKLLVEGYDFRGTAEKLAIIPNTVRKHIGNIYQKLHINSKAQAIRLAVKKGWI
jgi:DNA-binding NarL/FixJ family response regulator